MKYFLIKFIILYFSISKYDKTKSGDNMNIYNPQLNLETRLILNPDLPFHTSFQDKNLEDFFRMMTIPTHVHFLVSIYLEYEFLPYLYEKYPHVYLKTSSNLQELISKYFDFEHAHLYHNYNNAFYIVLFDTHKDKVIERYIRLYQDLKNRKTSYHSHELEFSIYCGVYMTSNLKIDPVEFYKSARRQFINTQLHKKSIISLLDSTMHFI